MVDHNECMMELMLLYLSSSNFMSYGSSLYEVINLAGLVALEVTVQPLNSCSEKLALIPIRMASGGNAKSA